MDKLRRAMFAKKYHITTVLHQQSKIEVVHKSKRLCSTLFRTIVVQVLRQSCDI
jgi:hypothetical protein